MHPSALPAVAAASLLCLAALAGCVGSPGETTEPATTGTTDATVQTATGTPSATPTSAGADRSDAKDTSDQSRTTERSRPTVTLRDANGTCLGRVAVTIAESPEERYTGLSETASLNESEGMLFVYPDEDERAFVMRNMSFPLDMIFVAGNGTVTTIHHAPVEPNATGAELTRYEGYAQYVLEVNRGYANATGLEEGDVVEVPES